MSQIASTYKARDVEEVIDIYFYRPLGYYTALLCRFLRLTPNAVTILSIVFGVYAGHLFYFRDIMTNAAGILFWIVADILDSADGQLARLTNNKSKIGRILDGLATNLIFISMYGHLYARIVESGHAPWWLLFVLLGAMSHSMQSALADYYRNAYLHFVVDPEKSELHRSADIIAEYNAIVFSKEPARKVLMWFYRNYTVQQEYFTRNLQNLRIEVERRFESGIPEWFRNEYRRATLPLMKYYAVLTTNTRMIIMSVCVLIDRPLWYFFGEAVLINLVMVGVALYTEHLSAQLARRLEMETATA